MKSSQPPFLRGVLWEFSPTLTISRICNSSSQSCHHPVLLCHYNDTDTSCIVCSWWRAESSTMACCWRAVGKVGPQVQTWGQSPALNTGCRDTGIGYLMKNTTAKNLWWKWNGWKVKIKVHDSNKHVMNLTTLTSRHCGWLILFSTSCGSGRFEAGWPFVSNY